MKTTKNYDQFKFYECNRNLSRGLILSLKKSITELGYVKSKPIIVNDDFIIIDGQHRFAACKELGIPIVYEIENIPLDKSIILLNKHQEIWRLNEYINFYAQKGLPSYVEITKLINSYPKAGVSCILIACFGDKWNTRNLKSGILPELCNNRFKIMEFLESLKGFINFRYEKYFARAVFAAYNKLTISEINELNKKVVAIKQQATTEQYLIAFENIMNYRKRSNHIRLI
jgi:ParB-like nuclease domain